MNIGDRLTHLPTKTVGSFVWQAPTGHIMFRDFKGNEVLAAPGTCVASDLDSETMIKDFGRWLPNLIEQVCETDCRCGGKTIPVWEDKPAFLCSYCMAARLLEFYYPIDPDAIIRESVVHARKHIATESEALPGLELLKETIRAFVPVELRRAVRDNPQA